MSGMDWKCERGHCCGIRDIALDIILFCVAFVLCAHSSTFPLLLPLSRRLVPGRMHIHTHTDTHTEDHRVRCFYFVCVGSAAVATATSSNLRKVNLGQGQGLLFINPGNYSPHPFAG